MLSEQRIETLARRPAVVQQKACAPAAMPEVMGAAYGEIYAWLEEHDLQPGEPFALYRAAPGPDSITFEVGVFLDRIAEGDARVQAIETPGGRVASGLHTGSFETLPESYGQLQGWLASKGETTGQVMWECYLTDPETVPNPDDGKTRIYWSLG